MIERYVYKEYGLGFVVTKDCLPTPIYKSTIFGRLFGKMLTIIGFKYLGRRFARGGFVRYSDPIHDMEILRAATLKTMDRNISETLFVPEPK